MADQKDRQATQTTPDLEAVVQELAQLKAQKWRGQVEYRLDGSGNIVSARLHSYRELPQNGQKRA